MIRVEPDSKYRCQGSLQSGQCEYKAEPGFKYCNRHGGRSFLAEKKDKVNMYKLKQWQERHKQLKEDPSVKSLRDELGLLRILIEERMLQCDSPLELMTHTPIISDLIIKATNVVLACQKIEGAMGLLVDKQALLQFADAVIRIIGTEVKDPAQLESIASQIMATLNEPTTTDSVADIERDTA